MRRSMGEQAGVPIEPTCQTALADATMSLTGVLVAGVPGAGGFDALFTITLSPEASQAVEYLWENWSQDARNMKYVTYVGSYIGLT